MCWLNTNRENSHKLNFKKWVIAHDNGELQYYLLFIVFNSMTVIFMHYI